MHLAAQHIVKVHDFAAISQFTLEDYEWHDGDFGDGRANLIASRADQPGGLCFHAVNGLRCVDSHARLALASPVGERDLATARQSLAALHLQDALLLAQPDKSTNRSRVSMDQAGHRHILRQSRDVSFADCDARARKQLLGLTARSKAVAIGNIPLEETREITEFGRRLGAYMALVPGKQQYARLAELRPHLLMLNEREAREVTGVDGPREQVFHVLCGQVAADHLIVMTCGGEPTYVRHVPSGAEAQVKPPAVSLAAVLPGRLIAVGAGDVTVAWVACLLGQTQRLVGFELALEAVRFAQRVAAAHLTGDEHLLVAARAAYPAVKKLFQPSGPPVDAGMVAARQGDKHVLVAEGTERELQPLAAERKRAA